MNITVRTICGEYQELIFEDGSSKIETGTLDTEEAFELAHQMVSAANEIFSFIIDKKG